ncbi:MAG: ABC transporter ATP-binding protein [Deltaproteobacteria bacterium]|nr:ABC transporter ATP-binding protein [Deltaproteobacteria bacterium]
MILFEDVHLRYPGGALALRGLNLHIPKGTLAIMAGSNGSGKSTALFLTCGLLRPDLGRIAVNGGPASGPGSEGRRSCALVFQDPGVQILGGTVGEDLILGGRGAGLPSASLEMRARAAAARFGLAKAWETPVHALSGGERKRLAIAGALLGDQRILLMDEPLSGLDYPGILEMRTILRDQRTAGLTQVVTGHDIEPLIDLADVLVLLSNGRVLEAGEPARVLDRALEAGVRPPCSWIQERKIRDWSEKALDPVKEGDCNS